MYLSLSSFKHWSCLTLRSPYVCFMRKSVLVDRKTWNFKEQPVVTVDSHSRSVKIGGDSSHHLLATSTVERTEPSSRLWSNRRDAISIVCASDGEHESGIPYLKGLTTPPSYTNLPCRFRVAPSYPSSANPSSIWGALYITFVRSRRSPMCSRAD